MKDTVRVLALITGSFLLHGCILDEAPGVEIGTGEIAFEPLLPGQDLEVIRGPQGGYHFLVSLRTKNIVPGDRGNLGDPTNPTIILDVLHGNESIILIGPITQGLDLAPASELPFTHQMTGRFAIIDIQWDDELDGETITLKAEVSDTDGTVVEDSIAVGVVPHPDNEFNEG